MSIISDERLAEIVGFHKTVPFRSEHDDELVAALTELQSLRAQGGVAVADYWDIQEYKVWKGIDPEKPVWASRGFCCPRWEGANELLEYLQRNDKTLILRVAPLSSLEASPAPVSGEIEADRARLIHILVVHFHLFRDKAEEAADLFLHHKTLAAKGGQ